MGTGYETTCLKCGYVLTIHYGVGMRYGNIDDLSDSDFNILHLIESERVRTQVKELFEKKSATLDILGESGQALYLCPECEVPYNRFWFRLRHEDGTYEPEYRCDSCNSVLELIPEGFLDLKRIRCPKCLEKGAFASTIPSQVMWD